MGIILSSTKTVAELIKGVITMDTPIKEKERNMNNETHNLTLRLKKGLYESLKKISEEKGITVHELIVLAIVDKYNV